jgi:hypothetical protein
MRTLDVCLLAEYVFVSFVEYYLVHFFTDLIYFRVAVGDFGGMDFSVSVSGKLCLLKEKMGAKVLMVICVCRNWTWVVLMMMIWRRTKKMWLKVLTKVHYSLSFQ